MHSGFNVPLGYSMLFGNNLAIKEYFDTFPMDARKKVAAHRFELNPAAEMKNHLEVRFQKY